MTMTPITIQQRMEIAEFRRKRAAEASFRREVGQEVIKMVDKACDLLCAEASPIEPFDGFREAIKLSVTWSSARRLSYGGYRKSRPFVSLSLKDVKEHCVLKFIEYKSLQKSNVIGSFRGPWQVYVAGLVAHEVAHTVQFTQRYQPGIRLKGISEESLLKTHGLGWQEIYRYLRESWVNTMPGYEYVNEGSYK